MAKCFKKSNAAVFSNYSLKMILVILVWIYKLCFLFGSSHLDGRNEWNKKGDLLLQEIIATIMTDKGC